MLGLELSPEPARADRNPNPRPGLSHARRWARNEATTGSGGSRVVVSLLAGLMIPLAPGLPCSPDTRAVLILAVLEFALFSTLNKASTLVLTGTSAAVGFGSNRINLGQVGLLMEPWRLPPLASRWPAEMAHAALVILASIVAGAGWSLLAALMKLKWMMNELITTLMLNCS